MKVLLSNPPWKPGSCRAASRWPHKKSNYSKQPTKLDRFISALNKEVKSKPNIPYSEFPFYLGYAAVVLEKEGHNVKVIDSIVMNQTVEGFLSDIKEFSPDILVIETSTPSYKNDMEILRKVSKVSDCKRVLCGPHVTALPIETMKNPLVDFLLVGEYEISLKNLVECLKKNDDPNKVKGIVFREGNKVISTSPQPIIDDLDSLPYPAWHLMPMNRYWTPYPETEKTMEIMSTRGCPYQCTYCIYPQLMYRTSRVRFRSPEKVVDEIEALMRNYSKEGIYFNDDTFTLNKKHVLDICKEIRKRKIEVRWACFGRVDTVNYDLLKEMKKAGCVLIQYGIESGSQKILDNVKKGIEVEQIKRAFKITKRAGINAHGTFMIGLPGESRKTIKETIYLVKTIDCDTLVFALATPFPGTNLYNEAIEKGWIEEWNWDMYDGNNFVIMRTEELTRREINNAFNYIKKWWEVYRKSRRRQFTGFIKNRYHEGGLFTLLRTGFAKSLELARDFHNKQELEKNF